MSAKHETPPPLTIDASIPARFRQVARRAPDHLAVVDGEQCITYATLDTWSEQIALTIAGAVGDQPKPVALHCGQGIPVIAAMPGVLMAGHFYAVLDTAMPENRVRAAQIERMTRAYADLVVAHWPQVHHCLAWGHLAGRLDMLETGQV